MDLFNYSRRETSEVNIGATPMGGSNPIRIQSMTNTATQDTEASVAQAKRIVDAGGEYVRLTAQGIKEAENLMNINAGLRRDGYMVLLVADYGALQRANMEIGINTVQTISYTVPIEDSIRIKTRSIMGTEIPLVESEPSGDAPTYAFYSTKESLDAAKQAFEKVKELTIRLSMVENAAYRLAANIKKTQKRANALKNITIPHYEQLTKDISNALEEKEREEFTRLKVIKRMKGAGC